MSALMEQVVPGLGTIRLRPLDPERDAAVLHDWLRRDYAAFWGMHRLTLEQVRDKFRAIVAEGRIEALVGELGEDFDAKSGALLAQAVTTLASKRAMLEVERAGEGHVLDISDVLDLARAAKVAQEARSLNLRERRAVAEEARRKLLEEQRAKLDELGKTGEVPADVLARVIKAAYDL